jgi:hypothetical protein
MRRRVAGLLNSSHYAGSGANESAEVPMLETPERNELVEELENDGEVFFDGGRLNNISDVALTIVSVFASLAATVLVNGPVPRWTSAAVAAVPAACVALQKTLDLRGRSNWYFQYAALVRGLATELKYATAPVVEEYALRRAKLETQMEEEWRVVGRSGITPSSTGRKTAAQ